MKITNILYIGPLLLVLFFASVPAQANTAPTTNGTIPDQSVAIGGSSVSVDVSSYFSDPDGDALSYSFDSSNTNNLNASITGSTIVFIGVGEGTVTITVTATDTGDLTASQTFSVVVSSQNRSPVAVGTIPDQSVAIGGSSVSVDVSSYFSDPDGDALSYSFDSSNTNNLNASITGSTLLFTGVGEGTVTITVTATDTGNLSASQTFSVVVSSQNRSPVAVGTIPDQSVDIADDGAAQPPAGTSVSVDVSSYFSDPDGDPLSYAFEFSDSSKMNATISGSTVTFIGVAVGNVTVTATATDTGELTATQTFTLTVYQPNRAPVKTKKDFVDGHMSSDGSVATVEPISGYFSDPDGDTLTYTAASSDTTVAKVNVSGDAVKISRARSTSSGTVTISITATDPGELRLDAHLLYDNRSSSQPTTSGYCPGAQQPRTIFTERVVHL